MLKRLVTLLAVVGSLGLLVGCQDERAGGKVIEGPDR